MAGVTSSFLGEKADPSPGCVPPLCVGPIPSARDSQQWYSSPLSLWGGGVGWSPSPQESHTLPSLKEGGCILPLYNWVGLTLTPGVRVRKRIIF